MLNYIEDIYINPPDHVDYGMMLKPNNALYRLKLSTREWNGSLDKFLIALKNIFHKLHFPYFGRCEENSFNDT